MVIEETEAKQRRKETSNDTAYKFVMRFNYMGFDGSFKALECQGKEYQIVCMLNEFIKWIIAKEFDLLCWFYLVESSFASIHSACCSIYVAVLSYPQLLHVLH